MSNVYGCTFVLCLTLALTLGACSNDSRSETGDSPSSPASSVSSTSLDETVTTAVAELGAEFVRFIHPDEWAAVRAECLGEEGWIVEITIDGGIRFPDVTPEQSVEMEAADERCGERFPVDPKYRQPLSQQQLEFLYMWYIEVNIPCLQAEGYTDFDAPSLDTFLEGFATGNVWTPIDDIFDDIRLQGPNALAALYEACPAGPPVDELYSS